MNLRKGSIRVWITISVIWMTILPIVLSKNLLATRFEEQQVVQGGDIKYLLLNHKLLNITSDSALKLDTIVSIDRFGSFLLFGSHTSSDEMSKSAAAFYDKCFSTEKFKGVWSDNPFSLSPYISPEQFENLPDKCGNFVRLGDAYIDVQVPDWISRIQTIVIILLPPLILFLAGLTIFWIIDGFRA